MIKNIVLDVGGVIFDDSKQNIQKLLNKNCDNIYKLAYGGGFKKCLLGEISVQEHINSLKNEKDFNDISYILKKENLIKSYPLIKNNFEYIKDLRKRGYKLFLLTNITEDSYNYINELININEKFDGGIYSYQEHLIKPDYDIYNLLINRFNLNKDETIFFDDKEKNVKAANEVGIKSYVFTSINDIESNLE
ncbi:hAD hydrolase family IA variant 3 [Clostridium sp. CAG:433]|nr:hAD hydrolase family IA variant 3 [Clostridium sp. CAG:433]